MALCRTTLSAIIRDAIFLSQNYQANLYLEAAGFDFSMVDHSPISTCRILSDQVNT